MKIHILPADDSYRPRRLGGAYPPHDDKWGVEEDFLAYLTKDTSLVTESPDGADWHYLAFFWTTWYANHGHTRSTRAELENAVEKAVIDPLKTFAVCQRASGTGIVLGIEKLFLASRKWSYGEDIPLLCKPHQRVRHAKRKYLASFVGALGNHAVRQSLASQLGQRDDIRILDGNRGTDFFVNTILESYVSLCPRGWGGDSFRFYESMQLGVLPMLIGNLDTRPFKEEIPWSECSLYARTVEEASEILQDTPRALLLDMGDRAAEIYEQHLTYGKWCHHVITNLVQYSKLESDSGKPK